MSRISAKVLTEVLDASAEPVLVVRTDHPDWPVVFANAACSELAEGVPARRCVRGRRRGALRS